MKCFGVCGARVGQNGNEENWQRQLELERKHDASSSSFNWQKIRGCPTLRDSIQSESHCLIVRIHVVCPCGFEIPSGKNGKLACAYSYGGHSMVIGCDDKIKRKTSNSNLNMFYFTSLRSPSLKALCRHRHWLLPLFCCYSDLQPIINTKIKIFYRHFYSFSPLSHIEVVSPQAHMQCCEHRINVCLRLFIFVHGICCRPMHSFCYFWNVVQN